MSTPELEKLVQDADESTPFNGPEITITTESIRSEPQPFERGFRFWMVMTCLLLCLFMATLDATAVSTALPTIAASFNGGQTSGQLAWVGSAYTLGGGASILFAGNCANLFGRRPVLLTCILLFTAGTSISGGAQSIPMLISGRIIQGAGAGALIATTQILLSDLVPLSARGKYQGLFGLVTVFAFGIGPFIGGAFATRKDWSWRALFYFNLPLAGIAIFLSLFRVDLKAPDMTLTEKLLRIDWIGNFIITASVASTLIGLTWGGNQFPWSSAHVLIPGILGVLGIFTWILYEIRFATKPFLTSRLFTNRTTVSGYFGTAMHGLVLGSTLYALPLFFQACKGASPIQGGADILPFALALAPMAMAAGAVTAATKRYRAPNVAAWCFIMVGLGLLTTLQVTSSVGKWIGFELITGIGVGLLYTATVFPVLAPLPVSDNGTALALLTFLQRFFQALGITITAAVMQNQLQSRIPQEVVQDLPAGIDLIYSAIPHIPSLPDDLQLIVKNAFAQSLRVLWFVLLGISALGFLSSLVMKECKLHEKKDERWGIKKVASLELLEA